MNGPVMDPAKWKQLIGQHLGRSHMKRSQDLMVDLLSVDCGLKPALLLDFVVTDTACVARLLNTLETGGLLTRRLTVVMIELDVLIINPHTFGDLSDRPQIKIDDIQFVDVSASLPHPQLLSSHNQLLQKTLNVFFDVQENRSESMINIDTGNATVKTFDVQEMKNESMFSSDHEKGTTSMFNVQEKKINSVISIDTAKGTVKKTFDKQEQKCESVIRTDTEERTELSVNPSTLFGLFLGYPVVYFYDLRLDGQDNCLSMVPLENFVVRGTHVHPLQQGKQHVVFSFSVPHVFVKEVEKKVEAWFMDKRTCPGWKTVFHELDLERRTVQLPTVCL